MELRNLLTFLPYGTSVSALLLPPVDLAELFRRTVLRGIHPDA
jgi:hypothetical protein